MMEENKEGTSLRGRKTYKLEKPAVEFLLNFETSR
jgi:hypothetical protein